MTLDEAIEIKAREGEEFLNTDPDELEEADRLSVEALKRISAMRKGYRDRETDLLTGETKPVYRGMTETMFINPERD